MSSRDDIVNPTTHRVRTISDAVRARDRAQELERRAQFLADASRLLASSIEYETTLSAVARLTVPLIADSCVVHIADAEARLRLAAFAHVDPAIDAMLQHVQQTSQAVALGGRIQATLESRQAVLMESVAAADIDALADSPYCCDWLRRLTPSSLILAPLLARGRTLGMLTLAMGGSGRTYRLEDLTIAEDLAARLGLAVDNARLFEGERLARAEAETASAAKSELLAIMSHEFRTPLQAIIGFADLLRAGIPAPIPEPGRQYADRIHQASQDLLALVQQLLSLTRLERGRETIEAAAFDVATVAREMVLLIEPLAAAKGLRFTVRAPPEGAAMVSDVAKLRQILYNLLANAVKFTDRGEVALDVRQDGGRVVFDVRDTGIGIAAADLPHVFEAFWQAERTLAGRRGGTGLGLGIARRLATLLGGDIQVSSIPGQGTTFSVDLPLRYEDADAVDA